LELPSASKILLILIYSIFSYRNIIGIFANGMYLSDSLSIFFKQLFLSAGILANLMAMGYVKRFPHNRGEFFVISVFALLGMMIMVSSIDFISLFLGIELTALSFIILSAYEKNFKSSEAGMKYMLLNSR
jgi:NADH-quinone oxidoreductase subunit N